MENKLDKNVQLRVAFYLRVSTEDQVEKYGLPAQRAAIEGVLKSKGTMEDGRDKMVPAGPPYVYIDDGVSGTTKIAERPEFARLTEDILEGKRQGKMPFDIVAVYRIDRLARKLTILTNVIEFFDTYEVPFISATESIDTSTPFGRAMLNILGVIAELELETFRERSKGGREQAFIKGVYMGSHAPFGYNKDKEGKLEVFNKEAEVVKQIYHLFNIEKMSPQRIAGILKEQEVLSPDASAVKYKKRKGVSTKINSAYFWRAERVRSILSNEIYTGVYYGYKTKGSKKLPKSEWKESPHHHTPIIYSDLFQLAQHQLAQFSSRKVLTKKKEEGNVYLLSGLLKCDLCRTLATPPEPEMMSWTGDRKEIGKGSGKFSYYYHCNRKSRAKFEHIVCPVVPVPAEPLEKHVVNFVKQLLTNPHAVYEYQKQLSSTKLNEAHLTKNRKQYQELLNAVPQRLQSLKDQHENQLIDITTLLKKTDELKNKAQVYTEKITAIDHQLSQITLSVGYEESFQLYAAKYGPNFEELLKDRQQLYDLIHRLIHQIIVYARPRNDNDVIAGRKKEGQYIPDHIDIYINLPQNLLRELVVQKFGVKHDNRWPLRDSNP